MYFSQVRIDPNDPDVVYLGGVGLHQTLDGGKTIATDVAAADPRRRACDLDRSGQLEPRDHRQRRRPRVVVRPGEDLDLLSQPAGRALLPRELRHGDAVQRLRRHAGQLRLVRPEPGARRGRHRQPSLDDDPGRRRLRRAAGSRTTSASSTASRRTATWSASIASPARRCRSGRRPRPASRPCAGTGTRRSSSRRTIRRSSTPRANKVFRSPDRGLSWVAVSPDLTANANRDDIVTMGVKGSDITISRDDGIVAWPTIVSLAESPKKPGVIYAGTDDGALQVTRDAGKTWTNVIDKVPGVPKGVFVSEVVPSRLRRGHRLRDVRRSPPERLRALHLRQHTTSARPGARSSAT